MTKHFTQHRVARSLHTPASQAEAVFNYDMACCKIKIQNKFFVAISESNAFTRKRNKKSNQKFTARILIYNKYWEYILCNISK